MAYSEPLQSMDGMLRASRDALPESRLSQSLPLPCLDVELNIHMNSMPISTFGVMPGPMTLITLMMTMTMTIKMTMRMRTLTGQLLKMTATIIMSTTTIRKMMTRETHYYPNREGNTVSKHYYASLADRK